MASQLDQRRPPTRRHVEAKHGWRLDDIAATGTALATTPIEEPDGRLIYLGPEYEQNGEIYQRVVVVAPTRLTELGEPEPKEIMSSYGGLVPGA